MSLPSIRFVVLDTETTGFVPRTHRVIEFAAVEVRDGKPGKEYEQLFHHPDVPPVVQVLTRIRTADLQGKPALADHRDAILSHLPEDALLVGQNISFDIGMLKGEGIDLSGRPCIDTSMLASLVFPELESYSLGYLSTVLDLNHNPPHRALGDVRATLELLGKCWERLLELPKDLRDLADAIMERGPAGYQALFEALPSPIAKREPEWIGWKERSDTKAMPREPVIAALPEKGKPALLDEPLDPTHLQAVIEGALAESATRHWIAVKSLRPILRRLPEKLFKKIRVLHPPQALIDVDAVRRFSQQKEYTADEATLALKLAWYEPQRRDEFPCHGGEEAVWNGKLSCTAASKAYLNQFSDLPNIVLVDHRELLEFLQNPEHPGAKALENPGAGILPAGNAGKHTHSHVIIDDASMLEDTATKAFGWYCAMDDIRACAQGNPLLTQFVDTLNLWVEKVRQFQDVRYLAHSDLQSPESKGLRNLLDEVIASQTWPQQVLHHLENLHHILQLENLPHRIAWIEQKPNGSQVLQSVSERIGLLLGEHLFKRFPTTLLIPQGSADFLPEILPVASGKKLVVSEDTIHYSLPTTHSLPLSFDSHPNLEEILSNPPAGKTVLLLPGKGAIEDLYVKYAEVLEANGATMICQGMSGGMGRMTAEFLAAKAPAVWLITPWMFEGVDLPEGTVHHLILKTLPFDHPNHTVLSRRSQFYGNAFSDYALPRTLHRLFRLLRTYARIKTANGDVRLLDDRISTKAYGKTVRDYLMQFASENAPLPALQVVRKESKDTSAFVSTSLSDSLEPKPKKKLRKKKSEGQPTLF